MNYDEIRLWENKIEDNGVVAYWSFDEESGDIAYDGSGNNNNGRTRSRNRRSRRRSHSR